MATATVMQFMHKTAEDEALRQQLEKLLGVGDGNISNQELDAAESEALVGRAATVCEFAAQNGFEFSVDDLIAILNGFNKHQIGELSDQELTKLAGVPTKGTASDNLAFVTKPMQRLKRYLSKTYLGITVPEK